MSVSAAESSAVAHSRQRRNDGEWQAAASPLHRSSSHSPPSGARNSRLAVSDLLTAPSAVSAEGSSGAGKGSEQNVRRDQALVGSSDEFQAGNRGPSSTESARRQSKQHSPKRSPSLQTIAEDRSASRPMKSTNSTVAAIGKAEHARDANSSGGGSGGTGVRYSSNSSVTPVDANAGGLGDGVAAYQYAAAHQITEERENIEYILSIREQPKHSRMCGVGEKADRRPIDPAPIIQLRVITHDHPAPRNLKTQQKPSDKEARREGEPRQQPKGGEVQPLQEVRSSVVNTSTGKDGKAVVLRRGMPVRTEWGEGWEDKMWYLENPYYFMYAMLASADTDEELHLLADGKTRYTTGSCVSCLYHLKDIDGSEQGFFVFPDLSIRVEGRYRLKLCLFETIGHEVHHCKSVYSTPFNVYTAKRFPGMEESTLLSKTFADQGLKVRVRKNPRARRLRGGSGAAKRKDATQSDDDSDGEEYGPRPMPAQTNSPDHKRTRTDPTKRLRGASDASSYETRTSIDERVLQDAAGFRGSYDERPYPDYRTPKPDGIMPYRDEGPFVRPPLMPRTPRSEMSARHGAHPVSGTPTQQRMLVSHPASRRPETHAYDPRDKPPAQYGGTMMLPPGSYRAEPYDEHHGRYVPRPSTGATQVIYSEPPTATLVAEDWGNDSREPQIVGNRPRGSSMYEPSHHQLHHQQMAYHRMTESPSSYRARSPRVSRAPSSSMPVHDPVPVQRAGHPRQVSPSQMAGSRDRALSDPYGGAHPSSAYRTSARMLPEEPPGPAQVQHAQYHEPYPAAMPAMDARSDARHRLPPLHAALSPEILSQEFQHAPNAVRYPPRSPHRQAGYTMPHARLTSASSRAPSGLPPPPTGYHSSNGPHHGSESPPYRHRHGFSSRPPPPPPGGGIPPSHSAPTGIGVPMPRPPPPYGSRHGW